MMQETILGPIISQVQSAKSFDSNKEFGTFRELQVTFSPSDVENPTGLDNHGQSYFGGFLKWGTPKSSILVGSYIISHPFWGTPIYGNLHINPSGLRCLEQNWDTSELTI